MSDEVSDSSLGNSGYALTQQRSAVNFLEHSPLTRVDRNTITGVDPVTVSEIPAGHLVLRGTDSFAAAAQRVLGVELPIAPLSSTSNDHICVRWVSPDEWLITVPADETFRVESELRSGIEGHIAIVNVSGGQTILNIQGRHTIDVLMKSTSYDVREVNFPPGKVVTTTFAQTQVLMRRVNEQTFELVVRRSFADYIWAWLRDATAEYGFAQLSE